MATLRFFLPFCASLVLAPAAAAQTVCVQVKRTERAAVISLDEQLQALRVGKGELQVRGPDAAPSACEVLFEVVWVEPAKDQKKGFAAAVVASTDPARAQRWLDQALAGEGEFGAIGDVAALPAASGDQPTPLHLRIEFVQPKTGLSKARQFRHVRKVVTAALQDLGMLAATRTGPSSPWPAAFPKGPTVGLYDAEGVGGSGCENIERVVDATTLGHRILAVCPEDIRDGGLRGLAAVVFPGGSGGGIAKALQPTGVAAVREFVDGGGGYVGICAGAYLAGAGLKTYAALLPWQHTQPWAKGSATLELALTDAGKQVLGKEFASIKTRYNNGPVYPDVLSQSKRAGARSKPIVLAEFASAAKDKKGVVHEAMVGTPAIVADTFGKGRVMVISPHPESHRELEVLVARAIGWTLDIAPAKVEAQPR